MKCIKSFLLSIVLLFIGAGVSAQSIATFSSVTPAAQTQNLILPPTHTFQRIIKTGDGLTLGGTLGDNPDFTGYVPIAGSSTNGYLSVSSEMPIADCAILTLQLNLVSKLWSIVQSGKVDLAAADIGLTSAFCSGTVTPKNTIMVCEEAVVDIDINQDGYKDLGWIIEIDPVTRTVINQDAAGGRDKLWAIGRQTHENVAIKNDQTVAYLGADNGTYGFLYKFVPTVPGSFSNGSLYVLETTGTGTGTWKLIPNTTVAERNATVAASVTAGAFNFNRIEDVEIGPDGKIYFASTATGTVYRLTDAGSTVTNLERFVDNADYMVNGTPVRFEWPDNLAFDGEGNLWVLQDGGDNHIWVVGPGHTSANPDIRIFANTPYGCEPTGITFSPDYNYIFLSIQHPDGENNTPQADASGNDVAFNTASTIVISRKENLGVGAVLPLRFIDLKLQANKQSVNLSWMMADGEVLKNINVERSADGLHFAPVTSIGVLNANSKYAFTDLNLPKTNEVFYRVKACDANNACIYSPVVKATLSKAAIPFKLYPSPAKDYVRIELNGTGNEKVQVKIFNAEGKEMYSRNAQLVNGNNQLSIVTKLFEKGMYVISVSKGKVNTSQTFMVQ